MYRPEELIENEFVKRCKKLGINAYKFEIRGIKGAPDRIVFLPNGKTLLVEFKQPGGKTSPHQDAFLKTLKDLGHNCMVCDNWDTPFFYIKKCLQNIK